MRRFIHLVVAVALGGCAGAIVLGGARAEPQVGKKTKPGGKTKTIVSPWTEWLIFNGKNDLTFRTVAFSPDGKHLAGGQSGGIVQIWDVKSGKKLTTLRIDKLGDILALCYAKNGKGLFVADKSGLQWWQIEPPRNLHSFSWAKTPAERATLSANGRLLALADENGDVQLWDVSGKKRLAQITGGKSIVFALAFAPKGDTLAIGDADGVVRVISVKSRTEIAVLKAKKAGFIRAIAISGDGKRLVTVGMRDGIRVWDVGAKKPLGAFCGRITPYHTVALSADGTTVTVGAANGVVEFWDLKNKRLLERHWAHQGMVFDLAQSPNRMFFASAGVDTRLHIWDKGIRFAAPGNFLPTLFEKAQSSDKATSLRAVNNMARMPRATLPFLKQEINPKAKPKDVNKYKQRLLAAISILYRIKSPRATKMLEQIQGKKKFADVANKAKAALQRLAKAK